MAIDLMTIFQGFASFSALIQAAHSALQIKELTKGQLLEKVRASEEKAIKTLVVDPKSLEKIASLTKEEEKLINEKLKKAKDDWHETVANSNDQSEWAKATDKSKSDQCALLRIAKQLGGGMLPDEWYQIWVDLGCP